jgi:arylsulfatase A-like enzyme
MRRRTYSISLAMSVAAALAALGGCGSGGDASGARPRLVVLYATCTLNKDFLSPYRPEIPYTSNLGRFAGEGIVLQRHVTEDGQSGIAFASLYAGVQADRHGVYFHPRELPASLELVTEAFAEGGYEPFFWGGQLMAAAELGYAQGVPPTNVFEHGVMFSPHPRALGERYFEEVTANGRELEGVLAGLAADPARRAFVSINFTITHELYHQWADLAKIEVFRRDFPAFATDLTSEEIERTLALFEEHRFGLQFDFPNTSRELGLTNDDVERIDRVLRLAYAACVHQLDRWFGEFLAKIERAGLADTSLVLFTADHGENFYEEHELFHWTHGGQVARSELEVPCIVRGPGLVPGTYAPVTRSIDVYPTLLGLVGLRARADAVEGVDLAPALRGAAAPPELLAFSHTSTLGEARLARFEKDGLELVLSYLPEPDCKHLWVAVRDRDLVFKLRPSEPGVFHTVAYDVSTDPAESRDVFDPSNPLHVARARELAEYKARLVAACTGEGELSQKEILKRLEGLGYVGGEEEGAGNENGSGDEEDAEDAKDAVNEER